MLWTSIWILLVILWECYFCERCLFEFVILVIGILLWKLYHWSSSACKNIGWTLTYVWTLTIIRIELLLYDLILDEREGEHERWESREKGDEGRVRWTTLIRWPPVTWPGMASPTKSPRLRRSDCWPINQTRIYLGLTQVTHATK